MYMSHFTKVRAPLSNGKGYSLENRKNSVGCLNTIKVTKIAKLVQWFDDTEGYGQAEISNKTVDLRLFLMLNLVVQQTRISIGLMVIALGL